MNRGIQFVAQRYCVECKGIYQELSRIIQVWSHLYKCGGEGFGCAGMVAYLITYGGEWGLVVQVWSHLYMCRGEGFGCAGMVAYLIMYGGEWGLVVQVWLLI